MFKFMRFKQKKDSVCARPGCNNQIKREKNGTEFNYCSSSCQMNNYSPGSSEIYDELLDSPPYTSTSSNQWGVWSPNQEDTPPSYSSVNNDNDLFGSIDNVQVTPLWETEDDPPLNTSNSRHSSSPNIIDDFPLWVDSQVDPLWTPTSNRNALNRNASNRNASNRNTTSRKFSPPATPRSNSPSDEEEVHCPRCTFFIRPNKTSCEMCGTSITRQEPKRSHNKSSSKPKSTITSYRDLYEEDENEDEEEEEDEDEDPFSDPTPRRNNRSSYSSRDNYRNSSSSKSRNQSSYSSSDNYDNYNYENYEYPQPRNQSSSRNRRSSDNRSSLYQSPTPPSDELWIDEDENYFESIPSRKSSRQRPPPKPYTTPSFFKDTESRPNRNVQKPPTPPLKEKQISCPACNFDNHLSMTHCEICYTQLNKTPEQDNKRNSNFNRMEQTRAKKACPTCSYYNDANSVQCEMCYRPMETIRKPIFSFFSHDVNMTQCPTCTFMNHNSMAQCEVCRGELPGSNLKQQQQQYQQLIDNMPGPVTKLIKLPVDDHDYMTVQQQFRTGVQNGTILAIFRVIMPDRIIKAHEAYQKQLAGNNPVAKVTHRMYHGCHVACDAKRYYGPSGWKYCNAADCGLCGIAQNGNSCARSKYGGKMWFASSSATSLGYCRNDPIKAMFVQEIISQTGGDVIIVDKEAATLVKFLIIFQ